MTFYRALFFPDEFVSVHQFIKHAFQYGIYEAKNITCYAAYFPYFFLVLDTKSGQNKAGKRGDMYLNYFVKYTFYEIIH
jgi:hypothetical protein